MADNEKLIKFIVKLTRLTVEGRLDWRRALMPSSFRDFDFINPPFEVQIEGMRIVAVRRFKNKESDIVLLMFGLNDETPHSVLDGLPGLENLYDAIQGKSLGASIEAKIDSVLAL